MHRVLRVINAPLRDSAAGATHLHSYSTQHLSSICLQYLPALAGASSFCLIPTYYEIGRDGEGTHHAGVFHSGPISLQLPVLHMRSSQSVSESVSQQRKPWDSRLLDEVPRPTGLTAPAYYLPRYMPTSLFYLVIPA